MKKKSGAALALALAAMAVSVFGDRPLAADEVDANTHGPAEQSREIEQRDLEVSIAGMTVFVDRETGKLRQPTAEEAAALSEAMQRVFAPSSARTAASFQQTSFAGGAIGVDLGLSQLAFSVASVDESGEISFECARTPEDAKAHMHLDLNEQEEK